MKGFSTKYFTTLILVVSLIVLSGAGTATADNRMDNMVQTLKKGNPSSISTMRVGYNVATAYKKVKKSLVLILVLADHPSRSDKTVRRSGTGFVVRSKNGESHILTNHHVIRNYNKIKVITQNDKVFQAEVVTNDLDYDVAILKIKADGLPVAKLGDSNKVLEGYEVAAAGYPLVTRFHKAGFGVVPSVNKGMINAVRPYKSKTMFQIDAVIHPGNSGGPLFNTDTGEIVGIVVARLKNAEGINFAIPINIAKPLIQQKGLFNKPTMGRATGDLDAHFTKGLKYYRSGKYHDAIFEYKKVLEIDNKYDAAHNNLGLAYVRVGKINEGIREFQKAIALNPRNYLAFNNLGLAYHKKGWVKDAIAEYREALTINPRYYKSYFNLGIAYKDLRIYSKAIRAYKKAIDIKPDYSPALNNLGLLYYRRKQYNTAMNYYAKALKANPNYYQAHYNKALIYEKRGQKDKAIQSYKQVIHIKPSYPHAGNNLGLIYYNDKQFKRAIREYNKVLDKNPNYSNAHYNLGLAYEKLGQEDKALEHWETYIRLEGPNKAKAKLVRNARRHINKLKGY